MTPHRGRTPLVLLHHSGGSAASFRSLRRELPERIDVRALELPGHGRKWREDLLTSAPAAVDALAEEVRGLGSPVILGESLGAYLAVGLAAAVGDCPLVIAVSNSPLATRRHFLPFPAADCSDQEVLHVAERFGALPQEIWEDPDLAARSARILRADFQLSESAIAHYGPLVVGARLRVVAGTADSTLEGELADWRRSTTSAVDVDRLKGGHLLSAEAPRELAQVVVAALSAPGLSPGGRRARSAGSGR